MSTSMIPSLSGSSTPLSERPASLLQIYGADPLGTDGELLELGYAADGTLWSVEEPGVLRQWKAQEAKQLRAIGLDDLATLWAFSKNCEMVASGSDDVSIWEVPTARLVAMFSTPTWITALAFSEDQRRIATGHDDGVVRIWDLPEHKLEREIDAHEKAISALAFNPDGTVLASAGEEKLIYLWNVENGDQVDVVMWHNDRIPQLLWHRTRPQLISAGWDTTARVWDVSTGEPVILLNSHAAQVHRIAVNSDGSQLLCADSDQSIHQWDLTTFKTLRIWPKQSAEIRALTFSPDNRGFALGGADRVIRVAALQEDEEQRDADVDPRPARAAVFVSRDHQTLAHLTARKRIQLLNIATGEPSLELEDLGKALAMAVSPDGARIAASLSVDQDARARPTTLYLWDALSGARLAALEGPLPPITALAFSDDSRLLASSGFTSTDVWIWDVAAAKPLLLIPDAIKGCSVEALAFQPHARRIAIAAIDWLATGGSNGAIAFWDVDEKKEVLRLTGGSLLPAFSPSGDQLISATLDRAMHVWCTASGKLLNELEAHTDLINCLAYDPQGRYFVSGGDDFCINLWDAETHQLLGGTRTDTQPKAACFSPDSQFLYTANGNGSCYQLSVKQLLES